MITCYRVVFDDTHVYQLEFRDSALLDDHWPSMSVVVYRCTNNQREPHPITRPGGKPLEFQAATEHGALTLAMDVLQLMHGRPARVTEAM